MWTIATILLSLITLRVFWYYIMYWEYKQSFKHFYNGKPKAKYPIITKPTLFIKYKNKKQ